MTGTNRMFLMLIVIKLPFRIGGVAALEQVSEPA